MSFYHRLEGGIAEGYTYLSSSDVTRKPLHRLIIKSITWEHTFVFPKCSFMAPNWSWCCLCPCGGLLQLFCGCCTRASAASLIEMVRSSYTLHQPCQILAVYAESDCCNCSLTSTVLSTKHRFGSE